MAAPLEWVFKLVDKMSAPAKQINEALAKTDVITKSTEKSTKGLDAAQTAAARSAVQLSDAQDKVATATAKSDAASAGWWARLGPIGKGAAGAAAGIAAIGYAAASAASSMFEAAAAQDRMNRAFGASLGGQGKGAQSYLKGITGSTELTRQQLEQLALPLARQGMGPDMLSRLIPAALDVQAEGGSAQQAVAILAKVASTGKIEGEAFGALNLKAETALLKIGARSGLTSVKAVKEAIDAGKISSDAILEGLLSSIAGNGMLGDKAVEAAKSPTAALNRFRNIQETVLSQLAESPALPKLTAALDSFTKILTSEKVVNGVAAFFDRMGAALTSIDWESVGTGVGRLIDMLATLGKVVSYIPGVSVVTGGTDGAPSDLNGRGRGQYLMDKLGSMFGFPNAGDALNRAPTADDFVMRANGSLLNINSQDALIGFKPGGPIDNMFGSSSGVVIENITISVDGGGSSEDTAARIAASIRPALIAELDRMALEVG